MNRILLALMVMVGVMLMLIFYYRWDSGRNRGHTYGYFGEFNTVSNALAKINGVTIQSSWHNADVTLEEFGFDYATADGRVRKISFGEKSPIRVLAGDKLDDALIQEIQNAVAGQTNNLPR